MVWRETVLMDERLRFVVECLSGEETMTQLCATFEISRKTGYKWLGRYRESGPEGLHDQPRAPLNHGRATAAELVERIVAEKEAHPLWGPKKIMAGLKRAQAAWSCGTPAQALASCGQWAMAGASGAECGVDGRPQGLVPDWRQVALRAIDGDGCSEPLPAGARGDGLDGR